MAQELSKLFVTIGARTDEFKNAMSGINVDLKKVGLGMTAAGTVITGAMGLAVKSAADFETGMREVNTMMGLSQDEFDSFSKEVQGLAADLGVNAVETTEALYQAISAGVPKENAIDFLSIATKAAIGGVTDTETAVDGLTTVINAFKMPISEAEHVADIMFTTVKQGKTTMEELSASMFNVAPIAATAGISFEEVSGAIATLSKQGVQTAQATTQIRQAIVAMIKPTTEMKDALTALGYESGDALISDKGLAGALNLLTEQAGGSNEMLGKMFGSVEGLGAVLALTGDNAKTLASDISAMDNSAGAAQAAFEEMENSLSRQMEKLKETMNSIGITIGHALIPILKDIVDKIKPIIDNITKWMEAHPGLTKVIVIVTAAIGALMLILGPLLMILPGLSAAMSMFGISMTVAMGPIGWIIAGIAALIAIGVLLAKNWDKIKEWAVNTWNSIADFFKGIWDKIVGFFQEHWDKILAILFPTVGIPVLIARNWEAIVTTVKDIWGRVVDFFRGIPQKIGQAFQTVKDIILSPFRAAVSGIESAINWIIHMLNQISFDVPDWVPLLGGQHFGINISPVRLPSFKGYEGVIPGVPGTPIPAIVHAGEYIGQSPQGITNNFNISSLVVREEADVSKIARELYSLQQSKARARGVT